jgi:membrane-associated phospholipid phosphatase
MKSGFEYAQYSRYFDELLKIGSSYATIGLVYAFAKFSVDMPRPYCSLSDFVSIANFAGERCLSSFPSAHTATAVLIFYSLLPYLNFIGKLLGLCFIVLVGLSRIALAMHFPADILYSVIFAFSICCFITPVLRCVWMRQYLIGPVKQLVFEKICIK